MFFETLKRKNHIRVTCTEKINDFILGTIASPKQPCRQIQGNNDLALSVFSHISPVGALHWPDQPEPVGIQPCLYTAYGSASRQGARWRRVPSGCGGEISTHTQSDRIKRCLKVSVRVFISLSTYSLPLLSIPSGFMGTIPGCSYSLFCCLWIKMRCDKPSHA